MVGGHRALGEDVIGEHKDTDPVRAAAGDEVVGDAPQCLQAVGREVLGEHAQGDVEHQHHVDSLVFHQLELGGVVGTGECDHHDGEEQQLEEQPSRAQRVRFAGPARYWRGAWGTASRCSARARSQA